MRHERRQGTDHPVQIISRRWIERYDHMGLTAQDTADPPGARGQWPQLHENAGALIIDVRHQPGKVHQLAAHRCQRVGQSGLIQLKLIVSRRRVEGHLGPRDHRMCVEINQRIMRPTDCLVVDSNACRHRQSVTVQGSNHTAASGLIAGDHHFVDQVDKGDKDLGFLRHSLSHAVDLGFEQIGRPIDILIRIQPPVCLHRGSRA